MPGGTSWPGRKMKAPGRLCEMDGLAVVEIYYIYFYIFYFKSLHIYSFSTFCSSMFKCIFLYCVFMSSFVCSDMLCPLIWWSKYLRSCPSKLFRFHCLKFFQKCFFPIFLCQRLLFFYWRHVLSRLRREPQGIIACCNPVPPLVRQQVNELHLLVQQAREMPLLKVRIDGSSRIVDFAVTCQSVCVNRSQLFISPLSSFRLRLQLRRRKDSHLLKRLALVVNNPVEFSVSQ